MQEQKTKKPPCQKCMKVRANMKRTLNAVKPKTLAHHFTRRTR